MYPTPLQVGVHQPGGLGLVAGHQVAVAVVVIAIDAWPMYGTELLRVHARRGRH
jgi:hypothetical protein